MLCYCWLQYSEWGRIHSALVPSRSRLACKMDSSGKATEDQLGRIFGTRVALFKAFQAWMFCKQRSTLSRCHRITHEETFKTDAIPTIFPCSIHSGGRPTTPPARQAAQKRQQQSVRSINIVLQWNFYVISGPPEAILNWSGYLADDQVLVITHHA